MLEFENVNGKRIKLGGEEASETHWGNVGCSINCSRSWFLHVPFPIPGTLLCKMLAKHSNSLNLLKNIKFYGSYKEPY